jgi:hypothetical protein
MITFDRNPRSRSTGLGDHLAPESVITIDQNAQTWGGTTSVVLLLGFLTKTSETYSRGWALAWIIAAPILLVIGGCLLHTVVVTAAGAGYLARNVAIVGAGNEGQRLIASALTHSVDSQELWNVSCWAHGSDSMCDCQRCRPGTVASDCG